MASIMTMMRCQRLCYLRDRGKQLSGHPPNITALEVAAGSASFARARSVHEKRKIAVGRDKGKAADARRS